MTKSKSEEILARTVKNGKTKIYESAHCTSCYVAVGFFLVLQNRTIGFEII
jgi:hypothetical protein